MNENKCSGCPLYVYCESVSDSSARFQAGLYERQLEEDVHSALRPVGQEAHEADIEQWVDRISQEFAADPEAREAALKAVGDFLGHADAASDQLTNTLEASAQSRERLLRESVGRSAVADRFLQDVAENGCSGIEVKRKGILRRSVVVCTARDSDAKTKAEDMSEEDRRFAEDYDRNA